MKLKRWAVLGPALCVAAVGILFLAKRRQTVSPHLVRIGILKHESSLPIYIADELGYFKGCGAPVEIVELPPSDHMPALLADRIDILSPTSFPVLFGVMVQHPNLLFAILPGAEVEGGPVVYGLVTRADFKGESVRDLQGGIIMAINPYTRVNMQMILTSANVDRKKWPDIRVASREAALQAVAERNAVAAIMDQPALAVALSSSTYRLLEPNPRAKYVGSPYWSGAGAVKRAVWESRRSDLVKVLSALDAAIEFIRTDPDEAHRVLGSRLGLSPEVARQCGGYYFPLTKDHVPKDGIEKTLDALVRADLLKARPTLEDFFPPGIYRQL